MKTHSFCFILIRATCSAPPTPADFITQRPEPEQAAGGKHRLLALRRLAGVPCPPRLLAGKAVALVKSVTSAETGGNSFAGRRDLLASIFPS